jgi:hypothetical protein
MHERHRSDAQAKCQYGVAYKSAEGLLYVLSAKGALSCKPGAAPQEFDYPKITKR